MIEEISSHGWKHNLRLSGMTTELVITLEVGPRILRYGFHDGANVFVEFPEQLGGANEKEWMIRGGHRFWTAPEADHSYALDNVPVTWKKVGDDAVEITEPDSEFGFQKVLRVELLPDETVRVTHRLTCVSGKDLVMTPWALSVMAPGGMAIIPQPTMDLHPSEFPDGRSVKPEEFLPNREFVLWPFTDLTDGRYVFSENFLRVSHRAGLPATKLGLKLATGWIAYQNGGTIFAKHLVRQNGVSYPDRDVNFEIFTNLRILELESLAPTGALKTGAVREHVEHWALRKSDESLGDEQAAQDFFAGLPQVGS